MTPFLLLLIFGLCYLLSTALDYDPAQDDQPNAPWHKLVRRINSWIYAEEGWDHA